MCALPRTLPRPGSLHQPYGWTARQGLNMQPKWVAWLHSSTLRMFFLPLLCRLSRSFLATSVRIPSRPRPAWDVTSEISTKGQTVAFVASEHRLFYTIVPQCHLPCDLFSFWPVCACRLCSDGKKTFSSRAMLEKHIQLRHRMDVGSLDTLMVARSFPFTAEL